MRIAALYDIHGNYPALEAVLREVEQAHPDGILIGGDIISGPMPAATLDRLLHLGDHVWFIRGNADREVVAAFDGAPLDPAMPSESREVTIWAAQQLTQRHRDFLAGLPEFIVRQVDGMGDVLFCHGSPRSDVEIITAATPASRLRAMLVGVEQRTVVCGHTHMPFDRRIDQTRILNAGSVGMPYGERGAYWLLLGPDAAQQRTLYDFDQAAADIRASGYPQAQDFADNNVVNPPTAAEAIQVFERMANQR